MNAEDLRDEIEQLLSEGTDIRGVLRKLGLPHKDRGVVERIAEDRSRRLENE